MCCAWAAAACSGSDLSDRLFQDAQRAERAGDTFQAYLLYARASALDPANVNYAMRRAALQATAAFTTTQQVGADPAETPGNVVPAIRTSALTGQEILEAREALPPPSLEGAPGKKSFHLKGDANTIFEKVAAAYGLLVVFEPDYQAPPPFSFHIDNVGYEDALRALETVANSFLVPINSKLAMVVRDTPQKRQEKAPAIAIEIPIPERISVQEAQEVVTAVQQTLDIRRITVDPLRRMVYLRDQVTKANAARQMFANLSRLRAQVEVDVDFLSYEKNSSLAYGLSLPTSFPLVNFGHFLNNTPGVPSGFTNFLAFGGGATFIGVGITQAQAFATVSKNSTDNLLRAQIVSLDGQTATLHVGNRYPIITAGYYGNATGTGQVFAPPPTINFEDLGLVLKVTPSVHDGGEITLDLDSEFNVLGAASSISGIPIIASRKFTGKVRLKEGEWGVVAGLIQITASNTQNGVAGAFSLPLIGKLFSENHRERDSAEVLLVLRPRLVSLPPWEYISRPIWVGTETRPVSLF
jgi:general secretion pathway protein D